MEFQGFVSLAPWTVIIQAANLLILAAILKRFLLRPVRGILERRSDEINGMYESAGEELRNAGELRKSYENRKNSAAEEIRYLKERAQSEADEIRRRIREAALREARRIENEASERMQRQQERARSELLSQMSSVAVSAAESILKREITAEDQERMLNEFIGNDKEL